MIKLPMMILNFFSRRQKGFEGGLRTVGISPCSVRHHYDDDDDDDEVDDDGDVGDDNDDEDDIDDMIRRDLSRPSNGGSQAWRTFATFWDQRG